MRPVMHEPAIALVTARAARRLDEDLAPLEETLNAAGAHTQSVDWDDDEADWASFDIALLRSAWDYSKRLPEFLAWAERTSRATHLLNPLPLVRWNIDKHYLAELHHAGVPTVPSHFIEPGESGSAGMHRFFSLHPGTAEFVVKPAIGAGSRDTQRYARADIEKATEQAQRLVDAGRAVLLQPYLAGVDQHGETSLIYYEGEFSHAVRKGPLLRLGEGPTREFLAPEQITTRNPSPDEFLVGSEALAASPFGIPLYGRVDLIPDSHGTPCVLELELMEPSMFFLHAPAAADRFSSVILEWLRRAA